MTEALARAWIALINATASWSVGARQRLGNALGEVLWFLIRPRRRVTLVNLRVCLPQMTARERRSLGRRWVHYSKNKAATRWQLSHQYTSYGENKMLTKGSIVLSIWCAINFLLAFTLLCYVIVLQEDSPILEVASFSEAEIASLSAKTIAALNCFTILYNSCSLVISVLTWPLIRKNLIPGQKSAFWMLVFVIGFMEVMAFFASSYIGHGRWQVNVLQSILYLVGIGLCAYPILKPKTDCMLKQQNNEGATI